VYVALIAALTAGGFIAHTPWPIVLAAGLTLPAGVVAVPAYYTLYGALAWVTGANPSKSEGSAYVAPDGTMTETVTGLTPLWFTITGGVLGVLILAAAAAVNVKLWMQIKRRRGTPKGSPSPTPRAHPGS
jgi:hypothetical protein